VRKLKNLDDKISLTVVDPLMLEEGWTITSSFPGATVDSINDKTRMYQIYAAAKPDYTGRVTVPVLWDKKQNTIVSNESADIIRMLNSAFNAIDGVETSLDLYPQALRTEIDEINASVYDNVNNGVYKSGFATDQKAYEEAVTALFDELDRLETRLSKQRYLVGDRITEADWRLFTTLIRFDAVYHGHFKCNLRRIADYPNLSNYMRELYQVPGVAETVNINHIKHHYYASHRMINPTGIVPLGPIEDFTAHHDRARF
jgi:putative glutathione S-transferase